jgi:hypothetical protein
LHRHPTGRPRPVPDGEAWRGCDAPSDASLHGETRSSGCKRASPRPALPPWPRSRVTAINCGVAVVALGYQTTNSSGRSFCLSGNVEARKPMGLSPANACMFRQIRSRAPSTVFIVFIFLDGISVDWTRLGARERYQPSCRHTQSFLMPIESTRFLGASQ